MQNNDYQHLLTEDEQNRLFESLDNLALYAVLKVYSCYRGIYYLDDSPKTEALLSLFGKQNLETLFKATHL